MANIRKSFNFRTGLQVDNDNFVVNANGLVGIGTSIPQGYLLNVHGDTRVTGLVTTGELYAGTGTVGVLSATSADVSGILTVGQLKVGSSEIVDNLIGYARTTFITDNAGVGFHTTAKLGINTTTSPGASDVEFKVHGDANVTGILTASTLSGTLPVTDLSGTLTNDQLPTDINKPTGIITASSFVGGLTGTATTASSLTGNPNITVTSVGTTDVNASGIVTATTELNVGTGGTALTALSTGRLGVGTALPTSEIQVRKASDSLVEVVSDSGEARISIGNSVGVGNSSGVLRFGNNQRTLDFINRDTGNINMVLHGGGSGIDTGRFDWIYGQNNDELMSLTYGGSLGIGITNPSHTLHVVGTSTVTGNAFVGGNLSVDGNISGTITLPSLITSNIDVSSGISTFNIIKVNSSFTVGYGVSLGIGTETPIQDIDARNKTALFGTIGIGTDVVYSGSLLTAYGNVIVDGSIGIGTTYINPSGGYVQLYAPLTEIYDGHINLNSNSTVGFDTSDPKAVFDFSNVGAATTRPVMIVPNINNSTITGIAETPSGSIIFNTSTSKFQGYTGTAWVDLH